MIATIVVIAAITEKKSSAITWKPLSIDRCDNDRSDNDRWDRTFYISAIVFAAIAAIAARTPSEWNSAENSSTQK